MINVLEDSKGHCSIQLNFSSCKMKRAPLYFLGALMVPVLITIIKAILAELDA